MKRFLRASFLFILIVLLWLGANFAINFSHLSQPVRFEATTVVIGDSHLMSCLDPALLPDAVNLCNGAESYVATFYKLERILTDNPQMNHVILGFSYNNLSANQDDRFTIHRTKGFFDKYYPVLPLELPRYVKLNETIFYHSFLEKMMLYPNLGKKVIDGGFRNRTTQLQDADVVETIEKHYFKGDTLAGDSEFTPLYLDSIIHLCRSKKLKLTLVASPLHASYRELIPDPVVATWQNKKDELVADGLSIWDFTRVDFPDTFYLDYDHLAYLGAEETTLYLKSILENDSTFNSSYDWVELTTPQ